jgi:hypothetical protein
MEILEANNLDTVLVMKEKARGVTDEADVLRHNFKNAIKLYTETSVTTEMSVNHLLKLKSLTKEIQGYTNEVFMSDFTISKRVADNSIEVINAINSEYLDYLSESEITPGVNGTISIEWENDDEYLILDIGNEYATYFAQLKDGNNEQNAHLVFRNKELEELNVVLSKIF